MNKFLLILGLTIIYYVVLFTWDKRRKAAFKKAQQQVIGHTASHAVTIPIISENTPTPSLDSAAVFGTNAVNLSGSIGATRAINDFENLDTSNSTTSLLEQKIAADSEEMLQENLEEMVMDLQAEQTLDNTKENLLGALANSEEEIMDDKTLNKVIQSISKKTI